MLDKVLDVDPWKGVVVYTRRWFMLALLILMAFCRSSSVLHASLPHFFICITGVSVVEDQSGSLAYLPTSTIGCFSSGLPASRYFALTILKLIIFISFNCDIVLFFSCWWLQLSETATARSNDFIMLHNSLLCWVQFTDIINLAARYWQVSPDAIVWLNLLYPTLEIPGLLFTVWLLQTKGLRVVVRHLP